MENNIKYIAYFIDKKTSEILCYLSNKQFYTKDKNSALLFGTRIDAMKYGHYILIQRILKYNKKFRDKTYTLNKQDYNIFFNGVNKYDLVAVATEYNIIMEVRKSKIKEIFK